MSDDKLQECCESWAAHCLGKGPVTEENRVEVAERLAAHLRKHGAIFPQPRDDGKTPGQVNCEASGEDWREQSEFSRNYWESSAFAVLSTYTPKPELFPEVPLDADDQTPLQVLNHILHGHGCGIVQPLYPVRWNKSLVELIKRFTPKPEPIATVEFDGRKQTPFDMLQLLMKKTGYAIPGHNPDSYNNALFEIVRHFAPKVESAPAEATIPSHPPTPEQIDAACLSYAHDFGLKDEQSRSMMRFRAREWLLAWQKVGDQQQAALAPTVADIIAKIPVVGKDYRHKESVCGVTEIYHRNDGELWMDYFNHGNGRRFSCPVSEWIESDYWLVKGEANE